MPAPSAALDAYAEQAQITRAAAQAAAEVWADLDPARLSASWTEGRIGAQLYLTTARAQELAATAADTATEALLAEQGLDVAADARVIPTSLAGIASDGRALDTLLLQPLIATNVAQATGAVPAEALAVGLSHLIRIVGTQVVDAGRAATGLSVAARPRTGYVRLVNPRACGRCKVLAGRYYRWSDGFLRHPTCNCKNIPAREDTGADIRTDPMALFRAMSREEQNRQFTTAGAQAIRDGADIARVVNARRGALGLSVPGRLSTAEHTALKRGHLQRVDVYGRPVFATTEGTNILTPRLMPESVYEIASSREEALTLLRRFGYLR